MRSDWPPRPHDPRDRIAVAGVDAWEVRVFPPGSRHHRYFAGREMLHLQLWDARRGISVLTPSRITAGRYEVFPVHDWKLAVADFQELRELVAKELGIRLPGTRRQRALEEWFVARDVRAAEAIQAHEVRKVTRSPGSG